MSGIEFSADRYVQDVLSGRQTACRWVRLACERHKRDLDTGQERGLWFDETAAQQIVAFFALLKHSKGEWAGRPVILEPWQQFHLAQVFGWKREDGTRRFRTTYLEVARKNGKTTEAAGVGLYLMLADGEAGAEVYSAAPLDVNTLVPTPDGWSTMGALEQGDRVFDEQGRICHVTYVAPILYGRQCYEVEFDDGTVVVADADHRWQTEVYSSGHSLRGRSRRSTRNTRRGNRTTAVYTTQQIADRIRDGFEISEHGIADPDGLFRFTVPGLRTLLREQDLLNNKHIPFSNLPRKANRQRQHEYATARNRYIVAVRSVESRPVRCISVDSPSHLYLVSEGMIATHNTKRDQARLSHSEATRMAKSSPAVRGRVRIFKDNIHIVDTASKFEPLGADSDTMDGLNVHGAIIDEVHAHKTRDTWDKLETATGSRRQPLMFAITTAGYDRQSLCFQLHEYTEKVLSSVVEDDSFFGIIYTLDEDDDWQDEAVWVKANPNLGVSKKPDDMRRKAARAIEMPAALNAFQRLELDIWTQSETKWLDLERWKACGKAVDADGLRGRICYGGLDLSSNTDISAWLLVFPPQSREDDYQVLCRFFIPEESMIQRSRRDRVPYDVWVRQGYITATPGNVIDYEFILHQIDEDMQIYDVHELAFDRWGASSIQTTLMERGGEDWLVQFGQGFASMSPPMKELEKLVLEGRLAHGNNPVLTWMADNLVARQDPAGNIKPDKERSREKIDGMVALIMGLDRALRWRERPRSVYEDRGLEVA